MANRNTATRRVEMDVDAAKIDSLLTGLDGAHAPGAVVGIAVDGRPWYVKGFGLASLDLPVFLTPRTRMPIASITKHFTCLALMLLSEEDNVGLDDRVGRYLGNLHATASAATVGQLMAHISGLRDAYDMCMHYSGIRQETSAAEVLALYRDISDINAAPGSTWVYNNGAYLILSAIIEQIAQRPLHEVLQERIFKPLGMNDTLVRGFDTLFAPNSASMHAMGDNGSFVRGLRPIEGVGQGGIVSTVDDMLRWMHHMDAPEIGSATTWNIMRSPMTLTSGRPTGYGLGLEIGSYRALETISHSGGVIGGNSYMLKVPAAGLDIIVMSNRHDVSSAHLARSIVDALIPTAAGSARGSRRRPCSGVFVSNKRIVQLRSDAGRQWVSLEGTEAPYVWKNERVLVPAGGFAQESVMSVGVIGDGEQPEAVMLIGHGNEEELTRASDDSDSSEGLKDGRYRSAATGISLIVCDHGRQLVTMGPFGSSRYNLSRIASGVWRASATGPLPLSAMLSITDGGAIRISTPRTHSLRFEPEGH